MPIDDREVHEIIDRTKRIEEKQNKLMRTVYGDEEYPGLRRIVSETKLKTDAISDKIIGYEDRIRGARWVIAGLVFLISSGAVAALISIVSGG